MNVALELSVLTLNVWGIPFISSNREVRIKAIADAIYNSFNLNNGETFDIVSLQEVWSLEDYNLIKQKTEEVLPYTHYFYSGVMGAGICMLSKYPILSVFFHAWSVNGYFHRIQHADWFGGKGVGLCKILVNGKIVNIYNTHLHAEYDNENDEYKTHRVIQAFDTAQFIQNTKDDSVLQILAGDLNTQPDDISYKTLLHISEMTDCCNDNCIGTSECSRNSYSTPKAVKTNPIGLRIDHIFAKANKRYQLKVENYNLPLPERVPGQKFSYSDHEAVYAKISLNNRQSIGDDENEFCVRNSEFDSEKNYLKITPLEECIELCEMSLKKLETDRKLYYVISLFLILVLICFMDFNVPYGFKILFLLLKLIIFGIILYSLFMAIIWNHMERNGILSSRHSMEIYLKNINNSACND